MTTARRVQQVQVFAREDYSGKTAVLYVLERGSGHIDFDIDGGDRYRLELNAGDVQNLFDGDYEVFTVRPVVDGTIEAAPVVSGMVDVATADAAPIGRENPHRSIELHDTNPDPLLSAAIAAAQVLCNI